MSALGLTDHNLLTGSIEFVTACREAGIQPILFPDAYRAAKSLVGTSSPLLVTGVMEMDSERGEPYLRVERVMRL